MARIVEIMEVIPARVASKLLVSEEVLDALKALATHRAERPMPDRFGGVPVFVDAELLPGRWRMLDQYGHTMGEGNLFN